MNNLDPKSASNDDEKNKQHQDYPNARIPTVTCSHGQHPPSAEAIAYYVEKSISCLDIL